MFKSVGLNPQVSDLGAPALESLQLKKDEHIVSIKELDVETLYVYDIETQHGVFHAGVGELLLKNTDSIFVAFDTRDANGNPVRGREALPLCREIGIKCSQEIKPLLKTPHDLEWEKMLWPFILFSKKRYVANKYEFDDAKFKQVCMGIVLKRRDNAQIVKHIYGGVLDIILNKHDVKESICFLKKSLQDMIGGKFPLDELVITKTLKARYKDPDRIAHKVLAERIKERSPGSAPQVNDRIPFVYVQVKGTQKVLQGDRIEHPEYIKENNIKPDYEFYLTNQVMKPVMQLFAIVLEQLDGYRMNDGYWNDVKKKLLLEGKSERFVREKVADMREHEVKKLLFDPILLKLKNSKSGQREITDFFKMY
jgi:DNA polymerase elongation subunit (family B)